MFWALHPINVLVAWPIGFVGFGLFDLFGLYLWLYGSLTLQVKSTRLSKATQYHLLSYVDIPLISSHVVEALQIYLQKPLHLNFDDGFIRFNFF